MPRIALYHLAAAICISSAAGVSTACRRAHVRSARPRCSIAASDVVTDARAIAEWVGSNGGISEAVVPALDSDRGLGLVTTRAIRRGDVLLSVPLTLALSAESALRSSIGVYLEAFEPVLADYAFIALALLHERRLGDQSELAPWLAADSLLPPGGFSDLPLVWEPEEITELDAATIAGAAARRDDVLTDYAWLAENVFDASPVFFPMSVFSVEAYTAAIALAISRSVTVTDADGVATPMLLPLLDLPNHDGAKPGAVVQGRLAKDSGFFGKGKAPPSAVLVATRELAESAPVCVRYGSDTAGELLVDHGFVEEPVAPAVALRFELLAEDHFVDEKLDVLDDAGLGFEPSWLLREDEEPPAELLAFLRLKQLGAADAFLLEPVFFDALWREHLQLPVSKENEAAALGEAAARCAAGLAQLGGSVQEDLQVLAEAPKSERKYKLAAVRYAERRGLQAASRWFEAQLSGLKDLEYYQERRLSALGLNPVETEEELDALRAVGDRAAGRRFEQDIEW